MRIVRTTPRDSREEAESLGRRAFAARGRNPGHRILRAYWRIALQVVKPLGSSGTATKTLALAKVTTP